MIRREIRSHWFLNSGMKGLFGKRNQVGGMSSFGLELLQGSKK